jgi:hypothetical protein
MGGVGEVIGLALAAERFCVLLIKLLDEICRSCLSSSRFPEADGKQGTSTSTGT